VCRIFCFLLIGTGFYTFLLSGTHGFLKAIKGIPTDGDSRSAADDGHAGGGAGFVGRAVRICRWPAAIRGLRGRRSSSFPTDTPCERSRVPAGVWNFRFECIRNRAIRCRNANFHAQRLGGAVGARVGRMADVRNAVSCSGFAQTDADGFVLYPIHAFVGGNAVGGAWRKFLGGCQRGRDPSSLRHSSRSYRNHVFFMDGKAGAAERDTVVLLRVALLLRFDPIPHLPYDKQARAARICTRVWLLPLSTSRSAVLGRESARKFLCGSPVSGGRLFR
jgi:hypothetical protein